jgi:hypothetical protein
MVDSVLQLSRKLLLALQDVPAAKPFVNDPAFIDRHLRLARDFVILNPESSLIEPAKTSLALLDRAKTAQEVSIVAKRMQDETVKLLSSNSIGSDVDDTTYVRQPFIVDDSDSLQLKGILTTGTTQFELPDYRIFDIQTTGQNLSQLRAVSLNKEDLGWTTNPGCLLSDFHVLRNGEIYYCPLDSNFQFQSGDKWILPRLFRSQNSPTLLSTQEQATIKSGLEQISEISKPVGLFVAGALYQWAYDLGETGRSILTNLIPDWRKLDQRVEEDLPKDPVFIAGRLLGNGAGVVTGLLGMISGGTAIAGGGSLCITGFGCFAGAPAIAVGSALVVAGGITVKEALENAIQNAQDLLSSGLNTFFSKDSSNIGSGSPLTPSKKSIRSLTNNYPDLKDDEAYAIQDILERASTKKDGFMKISEKNVQGFFGKNDLNNKPKSPEAIIEKRNGTLVAVEVKNQVTPDLPHAIEKFESMVQQSKNPKSGLTEPLCTESA